jgi:biotin synthase
VTAIDRVSAESKKVLGEGHLAADGPARPRHDWTCLRSRGPVRPSTFPSWFSSRRRATVAGSTRRGQLSQLRSVKDGGCAENCGLLLPSASIDTGLRASKLMDADAVVAQAAEAKAGGAQRFCMGAAWRELKDRDLPKLSAMISGVKALGLETCATLGMLTPAQAAELKAAGLDYYNHNLDTGPEYYASVVTTRTYQDRLDTLEAVRASGMSTCCGGIVGMGESRRDRASLLHALATLPAHPDSLPVNALVPVAGTPLGDRIAARACSTAWSSCAPSPSPAWSAPSRWCACPPAARP